MEAPWDRIRFLFLPGHLCPNILEIFHFSIVSLDWGVLTGM